MALIKSSRDRFAERAMKLLRARGVTDARYLADEFTIEWDSTQMYLGNVFAESAGAGREDEEWRLTRLIESVLNGPAPPDWDSAQARLRPMIVGADMRFTAPTAFLARPFAPNLLETVVLDYPTSVGYVLDDQPERWNVDRETVFARARENLAMLSAENPIESGVRGPIQLVDDGDGYFVSRLLLDGWLAGLENRVGGRPVAFIPERDSLIILDDTMVAPKIFDLVWAGYGEAARSVSPMAYTVDESGRVVPYRVAEHHPCAAAVRRAELMLEAQVYQAQLEHLNKKFDEEGVDIFVASQIVLESDGTFTTRTVWTDRVEAWLPRADAVVFTVDGDESFTARWDDVVSATGIEPLVGVEPERYHVTAWPDPETLTVLRALEPGS